MKKDSGITMIALIVTIILMLILAGITLTATVGDNRTNRANTKNGDDTFFIFI